MNRLFVLIALSLIALPGAVSAQELVEDVTVIMKARVVEASAMEIRPIPGTDIDAEFQTIRALVLSGQEKGTEVTIDNDYLVLEEGETFYVGHTTHSLDGTDYYFVAEPDRTLPLLVLALAFVAVVVAFGGKQGVRGLLALIGSLFFITVLLLPGILQGYSPILVAFVVSSLIITLGSFVTHGFNKTTTTAVYGMVATVGVTGLLAYVAIPFARLSGMADDEAVYLNVSTHGSIDLAGLLLASMLIGVLGVLYDAAIGQSVTVEELAKAAPHLDRLEIYKRALRIGREHVGALVNTLAIAYVGAALPLLLLFYGFGSDSIILALNREIFATEIVRTLVGSIGVVLVVPVTTAIAVRLLVRKAQLT